ncbi:hypothetical protein [Parasitella parasitica]|uniref:Uncharacterized protein n=1 Tax=Parasitella parasitica TaxID=35722 RepID=A0A0B7N186_9FUNG|nr:hypothetical protein [Parasitella parasitica]
MSSPQEVKNHQNTKKATVKNEPADSNVAPTSTSAITDTAGIAVSISSKRKRTCEEQKDEDEDDAKRLKIDKELLFYYPVRYIMRDGNEVKTRDPEYTFLTQFKEMDNWYRKIKIEENSEKREKLLEEYLDYLWTFEGNRQDCGFLKPTKVTARLNEKNRLLFTFKKNTTLNITMIKKG